MNFFDSHLHYVGEDLLELKNTANTSPYRDIFIGYTAFSYFEFDYSKYLDSIDGCFLMPACLKETNIAKANLRFALFVEQKRMPKVYSIPFIQEDSVPEMFNSIGLKEHFYLHNCFQWENRRKSYEYLNDNHKLLLLHCDNINRIDYVKFLHEKYPNMIIQIAHLGCFQNSVPASFLVIDELSSLENIYFDNSAVYNSDILSYAIKTAPSKILFGTDIPYIGNMNYVDRYQPLLKSCNLDNDVTKLLLFENARRLVSEII